MWIRMWHPSNRISLVQLLHWLCVASVLLHAACGDWLMDCGNCHCKWNSGKKTADCRNLSLSGVPEYLSSEVQVLDLSQNQILSLEENAFLATQLQNLHKLFIRNSTLQRILPQSFTQLEILIELDLSNNLLRELLPNVFDCLTKVRSLVLNGNLLQTLRGGVFHHLKYLHKIELKHNRLVSIDAQAFLEVPLLSQIYLDGNQFRLLHRESFQSLSRLTALSLDQNPWNCTCDLQEFRDFVLKMNLYTPPTACYYPLQLRSMLWIEDQPEAFACRPKIVYPARGASINTSKENVTLVCRVHGSPNTIVAWDYNKQLYKSTGSTGSTNVQHPRVHIEMLREEQRQATRDPHGFGSSDIFISRLTIVGAEKSDEGVYTCLAENAGGKDAVQMSLVVQQTVQRDLLLLNSNLFVIICLMVLGLLSISVLLSIVTYCIYRRFKQLHPRQQQHTHLRSMNFSSEAGDALGIHGVSSSSVVVAGGTEVLLNTFQSQSQNPTPNQATEPMGDGRRKYADLITGIDRGRNSHAIMEYLCNRSTPGTGHNPAGERREETLSLERKFKDKLNGYDLNRGTQYIGNDHHRIMPAAVRETAIIRQNHTEDYQPDVLPSNSPTTMGADNEDQLSHQLMLIGCNSRSKYNINVQKYLQDKYGSVATAARRNNNNINVSDCDSDSVRRQASATGSCALYPNQKVGSSQSQPQQHKQLQAQLLPRQCQSLAMPSSQRQPTDGHCRQPSPPPYNTHSNSNTNTNSNTKTNSNTNTTNSNTASNSNTCNTNSNTGSNSCTLSDAASNYSGGGGGGGGVAAITVTSSSLLPLPLPLAACNSGATAAAAAVAAAAANNRKKDSLTAATAKAAADLTRRSLECKTGEGRRITLSLTLSKTGRRERHALSLSLSVLLVNNILEF